MSQALSLKDLAEGRSDTFSLPIKALGVEKGFNLRSDRELISAHVRELADSIKAMGFRRDRPLTVQMVEGVAVIRDGHCRFEAVKLAIREGADITSVPCVAVTRHAGDVDLVVGQMVQPGLPLTSLEYAEGVKRLLNLGLTRESIGKRLGKSTQWVDNMVIADNAPAPVRKMIANGEISQTQAVKTLRSQGPLVATATLTKARDIAKAAGKKKVTGKAVKKVSPKPSGRAASGPSPRNGAAWAVVGHAQKLLDYWDSEPGVAKAASKAMHACFEAMRKAMP